MLRRLTLALAFLLSLAVAAEAQTADEIVAKTIAAQGGADKIKAIQSVRMTGTMQIGEGIVAPIVIEAKRPQKVRVDLDIQGTENSQCYDGQVGWQFTPAQGMKAPELAPADVMKDLKEQADMDGPLVDYQAKGNAIELVGTAQVHGADEFKLADAFKLKVTTKEGDVRYVYIDAGTFLPMRSESKRMIAGSEHTVSTTVADYRPVAGVLFPYSVKTVIEGLPAGMPATAHSLDWRPTNPSSGIGPDLLRQTIEFKKIDVNVAIDDARFKMPAAK